MPHKTVTRLFLITKSFEQQRIFNITKAKLCQNSKYFSTAPIIKSHIGRAPIYYPPEVELYHDLQPITQPRVPADLNSTTLWITGPLGKHSMPIKPFVRLKFVAPQKSVFMDGGDDDDDDDGEPEHKLLVTVENAKIKKQHQMWGTTRALIANYITGVTEGFRVPLRIVGVGYRANMEGETLVLRVGFTHPIEMPVPPGIKCVTPTTNRIVLFGTDKMQVTQFAANIRQHRKPEPYNQKGIFVGDETIEKKVSRKK